MEIIAQSSPPAGNAHPILIMMTLVLLLTLIIVAALLTLRAVYRFITKPKKTKECGYCVNSYILCCHDDNHEALHPATYCPVCGRKL